MPPTLGLGGISVSSNTSHLLLRPSLHTELTNNAVQTVNKVKSFLGKVNRDIQTCGKSGAGRQRPSQDRPQHRHKPMFQRVQTNFLALKTNWAHHQRDFSKSHFSMPVQRTLVGKQAWRIHSARYCRRYIGWSFTTTKAEEKEWRGVIHHTLNKSKCD